MGCGPSKGKTSAAVDALFDPASGEHDAGDFRIVRVWSKDDPRFDACVDVMARSFCGTTTTAPEPTIDWAYCNRDAAAAYMPLPEAPSEARLAFYVWCSKFILMMTVSRGGTYALVDKASSAVVAATGTVPPGAPPIPNGTNCEVMSILSAVGEPPKDDTDQKSQKRMEACDAWMARIHKQCMGKQKHLYVQTFFSDPTFQGKGCGKALLKLVEALADADGVPAYLETAGERNAGFYAAKGGFVTQATAPIDAGKLGTFDAAGGGVAMVRRAAGGGGGDGSAPASAQITPA